VFCVLFFETCSVSLYKQTFTGKLQKTDSDEIQQELVKYL